MITYEVKGGLFSAELLEDLATRQGQTPDDFELPASSRVSDEASRLFSMARSYWLNFRQTSERLHSEQTGVSETRNLWIIPLMSLLGYELQHFKGKETVDGAAFLISHRDANRDGFPVHIAGFRQSLDENPDSTRGNRDSAHVQMQEYLNHTEHLYGIITNGLRLRLLRDHHRLTGIQYLEWDLEQVMSENDLASFTMLYRMLHATRLPRRMGDDSLLEQYHQHSVEEGHRVRDKLKAAVVKSLELLGNGFLQHPENDHLRESVEVSAIAYGQQLRTLVYRLLFLFVAEDRNLVFVPGSTSARQELYRKYYSLARLRTMAEAYPTASERHSDVWEQLKATFRLFEEEHIGEPVGIAPLGGELFAAGALGALGSAKINNRAFLKALDLLSRFEQDRGHRIRINYRRINVEEFGAVYESLLELNPEIDLSVSDKPFQYIEGESRKGTGSYYTHQDLVKQLLKTALEPVLQDRMAEAEQGISNPEERRKLKAEALLRLKVCDPACGSGAFLVAAARALATELAYLRAPRGASIDAYEASAKREVIEHCIYGVDVNPDAAELCRLVLWMEAHEAGKPITYLDDKIRCGNSLVGWLGALKLPRLPNAAFVALPEDDKTLVSSYAERNKMALQADLKFDLETAKIGTEWTIAESLYAKVNQQPVVTLEDYWRKQQAHREWLDSPELERWRTVYNVWAYGFFQAYSKGGAPIVTQEVLNALEHQPELVDLAILRAVAREAKSSRFFHWPLEFYDVFQQGGFDVLLGNPPWAQIMLKEKQFFAGRKPEIVKARNAAERKKLIAELPADDPDGLAFHSAKRQSSGLGRYLRASKQYRLTCGGRINTYSVFSERILGLISPEGRAGIIVPTGIATDHTNRHFFAHLVEKKRLASLFDFENRLALFPAVDSRFKCCLLTLTGSQTGQSLKPQFAFYLNQVSDLSDAKRAFELTVEDFARINPNTKTCPVFRTRQDAEITRKLYENFPVIDNEQTHKSAWGVQFISMFNMSSDSEQFQLRLDFYGLEQMASKKRLYEAKMFWHYNHRYNSFTDIKSREESVRKLDEHELQNPSFLCQSFYELNNVAVRKRMELLMSGYESHWFLGFRQISATTNARTFVNSVLPDAAFGHSCVLIRNGRSNVLKCGFVAALSSLVFDFVCRQKMSGNNVSLFIVKQLPIIPPEKFTQEDVHFLVPRVLELTYTAWDLQAFADDVWKDAQEDTVLSELIKQRWQWNQSFVPISEELQAAFAWPDGKSPNKEQFPHPPFRWDENHRHRVQCELDAYFAMKYGLTDEELHYILDPQAVYGADFPGETFRVLKEKDIRKYGEPSEGKLYHTAQVVWDAWQNKPWERPYELPDAPQSRATRRRTNFAKARIMPPVMARIIQRNETPRYAKLLGRTKMEKMLHVIEAETGLDFGRAPQKLPFGPADLDALDEAITVAESQSGFQELFKDTERRNKTPNDRKSRYYQKGEAFEAMLGQFKEQFATHQPEIDRIIDLFAPLDSSESELRATLYAEWNNRLILGQPTDDTTLCEAAHQWSDEKQRKFKPEDFVEPLRWLRENNLVPKGMGSLVEAT